MEQITPASLRADAEEALTPLGRERIELVTKLAGIDKKLRPLVVNAVVAEVSERRISELTGLARGTIRAWKSPAK
ncbi:hypothetical protein [Streptantibioticus silvisoli]|uniref:Helix-turn-helix domain-containing protein n=1 Tax=Streptantibioticus silvisoli TaxID=2705255 RepID=A0ABT6W633_9ACTN|nr:hypothetical protein [Streptantibioticus silvisoli]MDI5965749.1 hypothetical protein [Streptantibioticus silvisoli]